MLIVIASTLTDLSHIVADFWHFELSYRKSHNRTERDTQGVGRDILIPKKLFLELCGPHGNSFR